jgi:hypothetical protein
MENSITAKYFFKNNLQEEIFFGEIVLSTKEDARKYGYHGTEASATYANPFFIKMTKGLWREFPNFIFLAEILDGKEVNAICSGLVPFANGLSKAMNQVFNLELQTNGSITPATGIKNTNVFYHWFEFISNQYLGMKPSDRNIHKDLSLLMLLPHIISLIQLLCTEEVLGLQLICSSSYQKSQ